MADEVKFHLGIKAIVRDGEGRLLLLKVRREEGYPGPEYWDIPGGRIEWGAVVRDARGQILWEETAQRTLERELEEETGLRGIAEITPYAFVFSNITFPAATGETTALLLRPYLCRVAGLGAITLSAEHSAYGWFAPQEAAVLLAVKYPAEFCQAIGRLRGALTPAGRAPCAHGGAGPQPLSHVRGERGVGPPAARSPRLVEAGSNGAPCRRGTGTTKDTKGTGYAHREDAKDAKEHAKR